MRPGTEMSLEDQFMTMDITGDGLNMSSPLSAPVQRTSKSSIDEKQRNRVRQLEKEKREAKEVRKIKIPVG